MSVLLKQCMVLTMVALLFSGCSHNNNEEEETYTVLFYMAADNSLDSDVDYSLNQIRKGMVSVHGTVVVYLDRRNETPRLFKISSDGKEILLKGYEEENSADPATLLRVIRETKSQIPSYKFGLVIWSHALGWVPNDNELQTWATSFRVNTNYPRTRYAALDYDTGGNFSVSMEISDLAETLPDGTAEFILFDSCLMASVESLYELRNKCNYIIASPTEILAEPEHDASGMPYNEMLSCLFGGVTELEKACQVYYEHYNKMSGDYRSATICLIDTKALEGLYGAVFAVLGGRLQEVEAMNVNGIQVYHSSGLFAKVFYDLADLVRAFASQGQYQDFHEQLTLAVRYKAATEKFLNITIDPGHFSGLTTYIPLVKWNTNSEYAYYFSEMDWAGGY